MTERIFAVSDDWALGADALQWILYRRRPKGNHVSVSFVGSSRDILARCIKEAGCPHAQAVKLLAGLPTSFDEWKARQTASKRRETAIV